MRTYKDSAPIPSVPLKINNSSVHKVTKNSIIYERKKQINIRHHFIRKYVETDNYDWSKYLEKENVADILTKPPHWPSFSKILT